MTSDREYLDAHKSSDSEFLTYANRVVRVVRGIRGVRGIRVLITPHSSLKAKPSHCDSAFLLSNRIEILFAYSANWAGPIFGNILERCARSDAAIRVAYCRIIDPRTYCANILFHIIIVVKIVKQISLDSFNSR